MKHVFIVGLLLWSIEGKLAAAELEDFVLKTDLIYGQSTTANDSIQEVIELSPSFNITFSPQTQVVLVGRVRLDFANQLELGRVDTESYSSISRPAVIADWGSAEIRDAYLERTLDNGVLRLGKQQIVWGKLDGLKVLDVVNPQDFREFILDDFSESRISLWSAYLDVTLADGWRTEIVLTPDNTGHAIPAQDSWFALTAPRFRFGAESVDQAVSLMTDRESIDSTTSAYGLRVSKHIGAFELGALAYSGVDHEPLGRLVASPSGLAIERFYERREVFGAHVETAFGAVAMRAEVALQPDRQFNVRTPTALSTAKLDQVRAGAGIDIDGPWDMFFNVQYLYDQISDAPPSLVRPENDRIVTAFLRRSFNYDSIELVAKWYQSLELNDEMYSLAIEYAYDDNTKLRLAADAFSGDSAGVFGQFSDRDRITIELNHTF